MIKSNSKHNVPGSGKDNVLSDLQKQKEKILRDMEEQKRRKQRDIEKKQVKNIPVPSSIVERIKEITPPVIKKPIRVESKSFAEIMREAEQRSKHNPDTSDNNRSNRESSLPSIKRKIADVKNDELIIPNKKIKLNNNTNHSVLKPRPLPINSMSKSNSQPRSSVNSCNGNVNNKSSEYHKNVDKTVFDNHTAIYGSSKSMKSGISAQASSKNVNRQSNAPITKNIPSAITNQNSSKDSKRFQSINSTKQNEENTNAMKKSQSINNINKARIKIQSTSENIKSRLSSVPNGYGLDNHINRHSNHSSREITVADEPNVHRNSQKTGPPPKEISSKNISKGIAAQSAQKEIAAKSAQRGIAVQSAQKGIAAQSAQRGIAAQSAQKGIALQSAQRGIAASSALKGIAAQSAQRGIAAQSAQKGIAAQSAQRGIAASSAQKGIAAQSAQRGIAAQSAQKGIAAQSAQKGMAAQSAQKGIAAQSAQRGIAAQSAQRGTAAQSAQRGIAAQSAQRGIAAQSSHRGIASQSVQRGILAQSGTNASYQSESDYEDEYDSDLDNFIDDTEDMVDESMKKEIYKSLNYNPDKYAKVSKYDDCRNMVSSFHEIDKEDMRSSKIGRHEDLLELKELEKASEKKMKSKRY